MSRGDVEALLDADRLIDSLAIAMVELSEGRTSMAPRGIAVLPDRDGLLGAMTAYVPSRSMLATKVVSVFPRNPERGLPSHQAVILAFDAESGSVLACMDGTAITALRTAAGSALATRHLARDDARVLSLLGTGVQAASHAHALTRVRPFESVLVWGRTPKKTEDFAAGLRRDLGLQATPASLEEAVSSADVIVAATHAHDPVVLRAHVRPGVHINAVGLNLDGREVDPEVVRDAVVVVEARSAALAPPASGGANDLTWAIRDEVVDEDDIAEIGEVISGTRSGRTSPEDVTLYKSVGVSVQDAVAASLVVEAAREGGRGAWAEMSAPSAQ